MLTGKHILLGVTGSIAAYKIASLASALKKQGAAVDVIMTKNATNFINPITFETLTGQKCLVDTFDRNFDFSVEHVAVAKQADIALVAPASANVIGKLAHGIADDMLTTTLLACRCPVLISPAMNTAMYENRIVQDNLRKLRDFGMQIIEPATGYLACGDTGAGKMPEPEELLSYIMHEIGHEKDLAGKKVLITSGPTREAIDPVRFISNHSTGKMGYALAKNAAMRGADVTLVSGPVALAPPMFVKVVPVVSAAEMMTAVQERADEQDIVVCCAAVADMRPKSVASEKIKKTDMTGQIELEATQDILGWLGGHRRDGQVLVGFSMETENMVTNSKAKLERKNIDMIVANNVKVEGAGFGTDTNVVTIITHEDVVELPLMGKDEVAEEIFGKVLRGL
ncbi:MAG: bifunctional phosphopantothenoylcysteine decarboxylase/phosphopantothenate--cysteine ligase CoaBC [Lachnospiraceae bacterium]|nr:bifunctional phosphopantothenoylcysteine decarboxylase/phosphopantothenate--cysteine ligase CoaBC [Lachnospiraceae bacterium]